MSGLSVDISSKKSKNGGFKIAPDGRLIIADDGSDDDDDDESKSKRKIKGSRRIPTVSDSESG